MSRSSDGDPFEWSVTDVVFELCDAKGGLRRDYPLQNIDFVRFACALRENEIDGRVLLRRVDEACLENKLGIKALGQQDAVLDIIETLRLDSAAYKAWKGKRAPQDVELAQPSKPQTEMVSPMSLQQVDPEPEAAGVRAIAPIEKEPRPSQDGHLHALGGESLERLEQAQNKPSKSHHPKRIQPTLVKPTAANPGTPLSPQQTGTSQTATKNLGTPISADRVFFSETGVDERVASGVLAARWELRDDSRRGKLQQLTGWENLSFQILPQQQDEAVAKFVRNRMKYFYLHNDSSNPQKYEKGGQTVLGLDLYSPKLCWDKAKQSMVVFKPSFSGIQPFRALRSEWTTKVSEEVDEWSWLDKYVGEDEEGEALPLYGDSGSENDYDSDTWKEMEQESQPAGSGIASNKQKGLTQDEIMSTINAAVSEMETAWQEKNLEFLEQRQAYRLWTAHRRNGTTSLMVDSLKRTISHLSGRLEKLKGEVAASGFKVIDQYRKQCLNLEATVFDRCKEIWRLDVLHRAEAPPELPKENRAYIPRAPKMRPSDLGSDEEELSDDDFVDWDNNEPASSKLNSKNSSVQPIQHDQEGLQEDPLDFTTSEAISSRRLEPEASDVATEYNNNGKNDQEHKVRANERPPEDLDQPSSEALEGALAQGPAQKPIGFVDLTLSDTDEMMPLPSIESDEESSEESPPIRRRPRALRRVESTDSSEAEEEKGDRYGTLVALLKNEKPKMRRRAIEALQSMNSMSLFKLVRSGLEGWRRAWNSKDRCSQAESNIYQLLGAWYASYYANELPNCKSGVRVAHVEAAIVSTHDSFAEFHRTALEILLEKLFQKIAVDKASDQNKLATATTGKHNTAGDTESNNHPWTRAESLNATQSESECPTQLTLSSKARRKKVIKFHVKASKGKKMRDHAKHRQDEQKAKFTELMKIAPQMKGRSASHVVNPTKNADQLIFVHPEIATSLLHHQLDGVRFMWAEIIESEEQKGCLLAHPMGLGKTLQVITLLVAIAEASHCKEASISDQIPDHLRKPRVLIVCPASLVNNWSTELQRWVPPSTSGLLGHIFKIDSALTVQARAEYIGRWADSERGVLLISYSLFRDIALGKSGKDVERDGMLSGDEIELSEKLVGSAKLVVTDEAQDFKNRSSKTWQALQKIHTTSRIALTGSPLANNLMEYFNIVDFIHEGFLGDSADFTSRFANPIKHSLYIDATGEEKAQGRRRLTALTRLLEPIVHRIDSTLLLRQLPGKTEFVIFVPLTKLQWKCYNRLVRSIKSDNDIGDVKQAQLWAWLTILRLLTTHPYLLHQYFLKHRNMQNQFSTKKKPQVSVKQVGDQEDEVENAIGNNLESLLDRSVISHQLKTLGSKGSLDDVVRSNKMLLLTKIVKFCQDVGEKVLVFSHSLATLDFVQDWLTSNGYGVMRMDGKTKTTKRVEMTANFNDGPETVGLVSTRAGGTGLNLQGASRIVLLDQGWNPMHEQQAMGRAFRIGQRKHVFIYRIIVAGSFEEAVQRQALLKMGLADRVVDKRQTIRRVGRDAQTYIFLPPRDIERKDLSELVGKDAAVLNRIIGEQSAESAEWITSILLTDSFLREEKERMTVEDREEAQKLKNSMIARRRGQKDASQAGTSSDRHDSASLTVHATENLSQQATPLQSSETVQSKAAVLSSTSQQESRKIPIDPARPRTWPVRPQSVPANVVSSHRALEKNTKLHSRGQSPAKERRFIIISRNGVVGGFDSVSSRLTNLSGTMSERSIRKMAKHDPQKFSEAALQQIANDFAPAAHHASYKDRTVPDVKPSSRAATVSPLVSTDLHSNSGQSRIVDSTLPSLRENQGPATFRSGSADQAGPAPGSSLGSTTSRKRKAQTMSPTVSTRKLPKAPRTGANQSPQEATRSASSSDRIDGRQTESQAGRPNYRASAGKWKKDPRSALINEIFNGHKFPKQASGKALHSRTRNRDDTRRIDKRSMPNGHMDEASLSEKENQQWSPLVSGGDAGNNEDDEVQIVEVRTKTRGT